MHSHLPSLAGKRSRYLKLGCVLVVGISGFTPLVAQQSLTLQEAVHGALEGPAAQIAAEQVGLAQAQRRQAGLGINPRLFISSEDIAPWYSDFSFIQSTEDYAYVGQTLEIDGKRRKRVALATANVHSAEAQRDLRTRQIAGAVAAAYWTAVADERIGTLLKQDLSAVDEMVRYNKERVSAGATRGVDLIRMQIERDRISLAFQAAQRDAQLARTDLFRQIGLPTRKDVTLADDISGITAIPAVDLAIALAQRIEITVAKDQIAAAEADVKLQHANGVVDPDLLGGYKRSIGLDTAFTSLQIPLPFRNRNQGEIVRAEVQLRIAHAQLAQAELNVRADIEAALENYERELALVNQTLPEMRARGKQNLAIETEAYHIGGVDLLRYIDAERTAFDVEVTAIRTLAEYQQAALRLQLAYGGQP
jgi:cobalt-zinc-cadmium efflux system outer membrane protein